MKFSTILFNIKHALFIARAYAVRYAQRAYVYAKGREYTFGFLINDFGPVVIKKRIARSVNFYWYDNSYGGLTPMQFMFHSELAYDFTDRVLKKNRSVIVPTHEELVKMFEHAPIMKEPTRVELEAIIIDALRAKKQRMSVQAKAVEDAKINDIVTVDGIRFMLKELDEDRVWLSSVDNMYRGYAPSWENSEKYTRHVRKGCCPDYRQLTDAVWTREQLVAALAIGDYNIA